MRNLGLLVEGEPTQVVHSGFTAVVYVLNYINRPVRTRMPGGVGGVRSVWIGPYPDVRPSVNGNLGA